MAWRECSSCKKEIPWLGKYYICSVSTCQGRVTNYAFCSVPCWDAHVPIERHKGSSAGALERKAPAQGQEAPKKVIVSQAPSSSPIETDVLVVVSKVRKYIYDRASFNTSASTYDALTDRIKSICDKAIENARTDGRKTVMDKDVP